jgi:hypothetical protein
MLWALFSLPDDRFVACLTSLFNLGLLTMPLTGPLMDPLIAPLMLSDSASSVLGVGLAGDQDCLCFLLCSLFCVESVCDCDCITDRRNRFADSLETASLNFGPRFCEASVYLGRSGLQPLRAFIRMRPGGVRRGLKKSKLERLRE